MDENRRGIGGGDKVAGGAGPGSDNPALEETYAEKAGEITTAEMLAARESGEEARMRTQQAEMYADQPVSGIGAESSGANQERSEALADREASPADNLDAPRADTSYLAGSGSGGTGIDTQQLEGRVHGVADRTGGVVDDSNVMGATVDRGKDVAADEYVNREYGQPAPPEEMDMLAPGMVNLPSEDDNDR